MLLPTKFVTQFTLLGTYWRWCIKTFTGTSERGTSCLFSFWHFPVRLGLCLVWESPCRNQCSSCKINIQCQIHEATDAGPWLDFLWVLCAWAMQNYGGPLTEHLSLFLKHFLSMDMLQRNWIAWAKQKVDQGPLRWQKIHFFCWWPEFSILVPLCSVQLHKFSLEPFSMSRFLKLPLHFPTEDNLSFIIYVFEGIWTVHFSEHYFVNRTLGARLPLSDYNVQGRRMGKRCGHMEKWDAKLLSFFPIDFVYLNTLKDLEDDLFLENLKTNTSLDLGRKPCSQTSISRIQDIKLNKL